MNYRMCWMMVLSLIVLFATGSPVSAQMSDREREMSRWLEDDDDFLDKDGRDLAVVRDVIERTLDVSLGMRIDVNASKFGSIRLRGWDKDQIEVVARKRAAAITREEARELAEEVEIIVEKNGDRIDIYSDGPGIRNETFWSVTFDVYVPERSDLSLDTEFGGISIDQVQGNLRFYAKFGNIDLERVSGRVVGETQFGSVNVALEGTEWTGDHLDVSTQFGGIKAYIPRGYSADLETSTSFGSLSVDFPIPIKGRLMGKEVRTTLGKGGAPIRLKTQFGGVDIRGR